MQESASLVLMPPAWWGGTDGTLAATSATDTLYPAPPAAPTADLSTFHVSSGCLYLPKQLTLRGRGRSPVGWHMATPEGPCTP